MTARRLVSGCAAFMLAVTAVPLLAQNPPRDTRTAVKMPPAPGTDRCAAMAAAASAGPSTRCGSGSPEDVL